MKAILSAAARRDIETLHRFGVKSFGRPKADAYLTKIHRVIGRLSRHPKIARVRSDLGLPLRIFPTGVHLVVYQTVGEQVRIIRVLHGHQYVPDQL